MIGRDPKLQVTEADDHFHPPTDNDPRWIETLWFPCFVPEQGISISLRVQLNPNDKTWGGSFSAWRGDGDFLCGDRWQEAMPEQPDLTNLSMEKGLHIQCLEPLKRYKVAFQNNHCHLNMEFEAIMAPNPVDPEESPGMFLGHFEQPGRATGTLTYGDTTLSIDSYTVRDRSWGPREMPKDIRMGNAHGSGKGTGENTAFFTYIKTNEQGEEDIIGGYYLAHGQSATIVTGQRRTEWQKDRIESVHLDFSDALDRQVSLVGKPLNKLTASPGNGVIAVMNLMEWRSTDIAVSGENHDIWSERAWTASGKALP